MSLFRRLFGRDERGAARREDTVWLSNAARLRGIAREAGRHAERGRSVLVVALARGALDQLNDALAALQPLRCVDRFDRDALRRHLGRPCAVAVALPAALPTDAPIPGEVPLELIVCGRNDQRSDDDAIAGAADILSPTARVTFHLSLDDPLITRFGPRIKALVEQLGMGEDEAIQHAMVTRAIERAQAQTR